MGVVMCSRCDKFVDLDYNVDDMVVLANGIDFACRDCLDDSEVCAECGEPTWENCGCKPAEKEIT